jgi:hypothetical protein
MAQDWIKMRVDLRAHPKIIRVATGINSDRFRVIGGLHAVWSIFDAHSSDGILEGYSPAILDDLIGWPGFSAALIAVNWLEFDGSSLSMPDFDEHNGKSAKARAQDSKRKKVAVDAGKNSGSEPEKNRTREEKRRIDKEDAPAGPAFDPIAELKARGVTDQTSKDWLELRKTKRAKVSATALKGIITEADKAGLPLERALSISCRRGWVGFEAAWLKESDLAAIPSMTAGKDYL